MSCTREQFTGTFTGGSRRRATPGCGGKALRTPKGPADDESVLFEQRDELVGIDHAFGAHPADQRLCAADGFAFGPVLGLQVDLEIPVLQGRSHDVFKTLLPEKLAADGIVIHGVAQPSPEFGGGFLEGLGRPIMWGEGRESLLMT